MKWVNGVLFVLMLPVLAYSFFVVSWTGSYIMLEEEWEQHTVFTPESATEPQDIYEIDKFLYAFKYVPGASMVFVLAFMYFAGMMVYWIRKWGNRSEKKASRERSKRCGR